MNAAKNGTISTTLDLPRMTDVRGLAGRRIGGALLVAAVLLLAAPAGAAAQEPPLPPEELARVVESVERLNALRERLAVTFLGEGGVEADAEAFREVCHPVGREASRLSEERGWAVRQMAARYRNPAHRPDEDARRAHHMMERHPDLQGFWSRDTVDGRAGVRYFRRITVRRACLECHGAKEERPAFIEVRYPEDRAFGFERGDLRGVYSVFVPEADELPR